jgi:ATP-dependent helicase HrpB
MSGFSTPLPIDEALPQLLATLAAGSRAVLVAPPGAGKTTRVPLALLSQPWRGDGKIIILEPRRLAARGAAERMAQSLGEAVGDTVGLRVRLGSRIGPRTRIEVVTEGVFARMILDDPTLEGVAAVLFDEFHERSLDADLGLALALDAQGGLREDLRILVMSATLDGARISRLMGDCPVVESQGRAFPVETRYVPRDPRRRLDDAMAQAIHRAVLADHGSVLAFLPGQAEIRRTAQLLEAAINDPAISICPLYGAMEPQAQRDAVQPPLPGQRKIVLATSIAETSLTIEGVRIVVDSGLARVPVYAADAGLTRLETIRVSRASADQRRGRAGRTEPGICYRLWEEAATGALQPFTRPEIFAADLTALLLDCAAWGVADPASLPFLDPPPAPAIKEARTMLVDLGALGEDGRLSAIGRRLRSLALPPRLARMVLAAAERGAGLEAARIAALMVERGLGGDSTDLEERLSRFNRERGGRADDMRRLAQGWAASAGASTDRSEPVSAGMLLAMAFPERVARARGARGSFVMMNGRGAMLEAHERLAGETYLAIGEMTGTASGARIMLAAALSEPEVEILAGTQMQEQQDTVFDPVTRALKTRSSRRWGSIVLKEAPRSTPRDHASASMLAAGIAAIGIDTLPWSKSQLQVRDRVAFLQQAGDMSWPDLSDTALQITAEDWLSPALTGCIALSEISAENLASALDALLPWSTRKRLDEAAPTHVTVPTGSQIAVDYSAESGPAIMVRVQELYGLKQHPALAGGRIPLVLHILSPAHRPIQITRDLPGFWSGSWAEVRADMKGRYPRHLWPEDPAGAIPTTRAKPRGT